MIRSSAYLISRNCCSREVPARMLSISARTKSARADWPNRSGGFVQLFWFCSVFDPGLGSGLGFPTLVILNCKFSSGALPLETPPMGAATWNPASCFGSSTPFSVRSALYSIWSLGPVSCNNTKTKQNQGLYHEAQVNNVS